MQGVYDPVSGRKRGTTSKPVERVTRTKSDERLSAAAPRTANEWGGEGGSPPAAAAPLPPYNFDETVNPIQLLILAWADTIHDFWAGYRSKKDGSVSANAIRPILVNMFRASVSAAVDDITAQAAAAAVVTLIENKLREIAEATDRDKIKILVSDIEDTVRDYFNDFTEYLERPNPKATYSQTDVAAGTLADAALEWRNTTDTFTLTTGKKRIAKMTVVEKENIGKFILNFLFGSHADFLAEFICDTAPAKVAQVFENFSNVCALLTPQNFADSATTSIGQKIGKSPTLFSFPVNRDGTFVSRRAILTPEFEVSYENTGFCDKKPYGFKYVIKSRTNPAAREEFEFSASERQGPSLNYLLAAHLKMSELPEGSTAAVIRAALNKIVIQSGCLRVAEIDNDALLLEIFAGVKANKSIWEELKRLGDQDQDDAAAYLFRSGRKVVLVTIDRPCFLLARILGIPCILHNKDTFVISRNRLADKPPTAEEIAAFKVAKTAKFVANYSDLYNTLSTSLDFLRGFYSSIPDIDDVRWPKKRGEGDNIMKQVLKLRLDDIKKYLIKIINTVYTVGDQINRDALTAEKRIADIELVTWTNLGTLDEAGEKETTIRAMLDNFTANGIDSSALINLTQLLSRGLMFNVDEEYDELNFSLEDFSTLAAAYRTIVFTINKNFKDRHIDFLEALATYNVSVAGVCDGFIDKEEGKRVESALVLPQVTRADNILDESKIAIDIYTDAKTALRDRDTEAIAAVNALKAAVTRAKAAADERFVAAQEFLKTQIACVRDPNVDPPPQCIQVGGAGWDDVPEKRKMVIDIFVEICREAAAFVNQIYSTRNPTELKQYAATRLENDIAKGEPVHITNSTDLTRSLNSLIVEDPTSYADTSKKFIEYLANTDIDDFAYSLFSKWKFGLEKIKEDADADVDVDTLLRADATAKLIGVLLDPFTDRAPDAVRSRDYWLLDLAVAHPFNKIPARWADKDDADIIATVIPNMLVTLAFMNDLIEGNVGIGTSYFAHMVIRGAIPATFRTYNIYDPLEWNRCAGTLTIVVQALTGDTGLRREALLLAGGARKTRKRKVKGRRYTKRR